MKEIKELKLQWEQKTNELKVFKEQLEKMFYLEPLAMNAWEIARDRFIEQVEEFNRADC